MVYEVGKSVIAIDVDFSKADGAVKRFNKRVESELGKRKKLNMEITPKVIGLGGRGNQAGMGSGKTIAGAGRGNLGSSSTSGVISSGKVRGNFIDSKSGPTMTGPGGIDQKAQLKTIKAEDKLRKKGLRVSEMISRMNEKSLKSEKKQETLLGKLTSLFGNFYVRMGKGGPRGGWSGINPFKMLNGGGGTSSNITKDVIGGSLGTKAVSSTGKAASTAKVASTATAGTMGTAIAASGPLAALVAVAMGIFILGKKILKAVKDSEGWKFLSDVFRGAIGSVISMILIVGFKIQEIFKLIDTDWTDPLGLDSFLPDWVTLGTDFMGIFPDWPSITTKFANIFPDWVGAGTDFLSIFPNWEEITTLFGGIFPAWDVITTSFSGIFPAWDTITTSFNDIFPDWTALGTHFVGIFPVWEDIKTSFSGIFPDWETIKTSFSGLFNFESWGTSLDGLFNFDDLSIDLGGMLNFDTWTTKFNDMFDFTTWTEKFNNIFDFGGWADRFDDLFDFSGKKDSVRDWVDNHLTGG